MINKVWLKVKQKGPLVALAIILPGGELLLLGDWLYSKFKRKKVDIPEPEEIKLVA